MFYRPIVILMTLSCSCQVFGQTRGQQKPQPQERVTLGQISAAFQRLTRRVAPAVVQITTTGLFPVEGEAQGEVTAQSGTGSGVLLDPEGYIVTNAHVVEGADKVQVLLVNTRSAGVASESSPEPAEDPVDARILGMDTDTDLAVLKIERKGLPNLKLADSSRLRQGQLVLACGSPFGLENTVSMGIISSISRQLRPQDLTPYIQTDAPINPGNSGGPLIDTHGDVVGINTMILSRSGGNEGLGFAIPSNVVVNAYRQIRKDGHVHHGYIGVHVIAINETISKGLHLPNPWGVLLEDVVPDGPGDLAGLKPGDVLLSVDGKALRDARRFGMQIAHRAIGEELSMEVLRGTEKLNFSVPVRERPDDPFRFAHLVQKEANFIPQLGVLVLDLNEELMARLPPLRKPAGVIVAAKVLGAPAPPGELEAGDIISALNGQLVANIAALRALLEKMHSDDPVVIQLQRGSSLLLVAFDMP